MPFPKLTRSQQSDTWQYHPWVIQDLFLVVSIGKKVLQRRTGVYKDAYQLKITNHNDKENN